MHTSSPSAWQCLSLLRAPPPQLAEHADHGDQGEKAGQLLVPHSAASSAAPSHAPVSTPV